MGSVDNQVCGCDQSHVLAPIVRHLGQVCIGLVAGVSGQPGAHVEKQAVGDGILVVITSVGRGNLPPETSTTIHAIPSRRLSVEHSLGQSQPLRFILGGVGKCSFGGRKDGETPESLIVVTEGECLCVGFVVFILTDLVEQSFGHDFVELGVTRVMPVVDPALNMSPHISAIVVPPLTQKRANEGRNQESRKRGGGVKSQAGPRKSRLNTPITAPPSHQK